MPLKKVQEKTMWHSGITFLQNIFLNFIFSIDLFDGLGHRNKNLSFQIIVNLIQWWLLSSCVKVHLFCKGNVLQRDYTLHRKYFDLAISVAFISSLFFSSYFNRR